MNKYIIFLTLITLLHLIGCKHTPINLIANKIEGYTPLMDAAAENNEEDLKKLLSEGEYIDQKSKYGWTALTFAVSNNNIDSAKLLLKAGASPNITTLRIPGRSKPGSEIMPTTPLTKAIRWNNHKMIKLLLKHGALIDPTAVAMAGVYGRTDILKLFKEFDVNFNLEGLNHYHPTALISASMNGDYATVEWLVKNGADPNFHANGETPLSSSFYSSFNFEDMINNKITSFLIDNGADVFKEENLRSILISYLPENSNGFTLRNGGLKFLLHHGVTPSIKFSIRENSENRPLCYYVVSYIFNYCMVPDEPLKTIYKEQLNLLFESGASKDISFYEMILSEEPLQPKYKKTLIKNKKALISLIKEFIKKYSKEN